MSSQALVAQTPQQTPDQAPVADTQGATHAPGSMGWAMDLANRSGNQWLIGLISSLSGDSVGSAIQGIGANTTATTTAAPTTTSTTTTTTTTPDASATVQPPQLSVRVTASRLNVRSSADSSAANNLVGQLAQGAQVAVVGTQGDWYLIEYQGQPAYIKSSFTTPVQTTGTGGPNRTDTTAPVAGAPTTGTVGDTTDTGGEVAVGSATAQTRITQLANDYNSIPVWGPGVATDQAPTTTIRTPYVLATVAEADEASSIKGLTIAEGRPNAGKTVRQAATNNPFVGKGTPAQIQIAAQAVIDGGLATTANLQTYINQGRQRESGNRNGKFGVDCSGFTGIAMNELEGNGRQNNTSNNAVSYRHDGGRGFTPISPENAAAGDVISYETTNHVVVVYNKQDIQIPMVGGTEGGATKRAVKISVAESTASQNGDNAQYVRTDRGFWYFPGATTVMGAANNAGPEWKLVSSAGDALPKYQGQLSAASYSGNSSWTTGFTLNCAGDAQGTNLRTRGADGRFATTASRIPNGAGGVELKEVSGDMVRVRYNGNDTLNGAETWAPLRYVATMGSSFTIPSNGQPAGMRVNTFSVVRNPNLPGPAPQEAPAGGGAT